MKLSVMSYNYGRSLASGALSLRDVLEELARLQVDGVELMRAHAAGWGTPELGSRLQDLGLAVPVLLESAAIVDPDPARRAAAVQGMHPAIDLAAALGSQAIMLLPGGSAAGAPDAEVRRWIGEGIRAACELARGSGVRIIVENHGGAARLRGRVEHMLEFQAAAPEMGLCFDTGNFFLAGEDLGAAFDALAPYVVHTHFKDWSPSPDGQSGVAALPGGRYVGAAIGDGVVPNVVAARRLAAAGYTGYASVEYEGPDDPLAGTARAVAGLRRVLQEAEA